MSLCSFGIVNFSSLPFVSLDSLDSLGSEVRKVDSPEKAELSE